MEDVLKYIKKSFDLKNQGYYKQAIEMLYKALSIENDNVEILAQLAQLYNLLKNKQRALHYIDKVLDINPNHLDCLILMKQIYIEQKEIKKAEEIAEKIYKISPNDKNLAEMISLLTKIKDFEKIKNIEEAFENHSDIVLYELGCANLADNNIEKAIDLLEKGYEQNNSNKDILYQLGKIYYNQKDFDKAKKIFSELKEINPSAEVMNYLGLFKLDEGNYTQAIDLFIKAKEFDDKNAEYLYNLACAYFLQGWLDEAEKYFKESVNLETKQEKYHYSLAYLYYQKSEYEKAVFELNCVKKINDNHEPSKVLQAMIDAKKGDLIGAKITLENIIKAYPLDDFAFSALSKIYKELSMNNEAKQTIEHALVLKGNSLEYFSELIDLEIEFKNYDNAKEYIDKILAKNDKYVYAYIASAKIDLIKENYDSLYDNAQIIIDLDENSPEGYYYNAIALFKQGDNDFAIESLKKSISLDVNNANLYSKMSEIYQELGDFENAYLWAKEASDIDEKSYKLKWMCAKLAVNLHNERDAIKFYSLSFRLGSFDEELIDDYSRYLNSLGKTKQAKAIRDSAKKMINKNLSLK